MPVNNESKQIIIRRLNEDAGFPGPSREIFAEVSAEDLEAGPGDSWGFVGSATVLVPFLVDLPAMTRGNFTDLAIDVYAPAIPANRDLIYEVDLRLRDETTETKVFRTFAQRHQFFISAQLLFEDNNILTLSARQLAGGATIPRFFVRFFYMQRDRLIQSLEKNSVWVFSTARSGSTWLCQDLLCSEGKARPMDEPGIGRMFAPLDWVAERFYNPWGRPGYFESGFEFETGVRTRGNQTGLPPFERTFVYAHQENKIWNAQSWKTYLGALKETVFRHVINEWGMINYKNVVFKMPNDSHAADVIMQAFPGSFMIFLMRDGRDVMKSRFSRFASVNLSETRDIQMRLYAIAFYSHFWNFQVDIIHSAFNAHAPERSLLVYYEDLRRDTMAQAREIFDRIGFSITDEELSELIRRTQLENIPDDQKGPDKPRQTGQIGEFGKVFSEQEIELMEAIMGPNLVRFGYKLL